MVVPGRQTGRALSGRLEGWPRFQRPRADQVARRGDPVGRTRRKGLPHTFEDQVELLGVLVEGFHRVGEDGAAPRRRGQIVFPMGLS